MKIVDKRIDKKVTFDGLYMGDTFSDNNYADAIFMKIEEVKQEDCIFNCVCLESGKCFYYRKDEKVVPVECEVVVVG